MPEDFSGAKRRAAMPRGMRPELADSFKADASYVEHPSDPKNPPVFFDEAASPIGPSFNWACTHKKSACGSGHIGVRRDFRDLRTNSRLSRSGTASYLRQGGPISL